MFYIVCNSLEERIGLIAFLKENKILSVFHYQSLHSSTYYSDKHDRRPLNNADNFTGCLLRLPMYFELSLSEVDFICSLIKKYYN